MAQRVGHFFNRQPAFLLFILILFSYSINNANSVLDNNNNSYNNQIIINNVEPINFNNNSLQYRDDVNYGCLIKVTGINVYYLNFTYWSFKQIDCLNNGYLVEKIWTSDDKTQIIFGGKQICPDNEVTNIYFCQPNLDNFDGLIQSNQFNYTLIQLNNERKKRDVNSESQKKLDEIRIEGLNIEFAEVNPIFDDDGTPQILIKRKAVIRLFGTGLNNNTLIKFTDERKNFNEVCENAKSDVFKVKTVSNSTATVEINLPEVGSFFICVKSHEERIEKTNQNIPIYFHQGTESYKMVHTYQKTLPFWLQVSIILICLSFSALFSGLNLGLMAMDRTELKILCNTGTEKEKQYARTIQPVRNHGNYLLCSILFSNVLVNSIFTILLDDLTSGLVAVICSTLAIVIFGEISPQAICSRHGLCVGAKTIYITKLTMFLTFPLSYPISKLLDLLLGEEIGNVYNRERLKELVKVTTGYNDLEKDEVNIIAGALELRKKTVVDVMTRIEDVYMLNYNAILDFETVSEIMKSGYSRIPVYEGSRNNIITMLYIKDLAFVDPDDNTPLKTLCQFYQNPCNFVFEDVTLDVMFKQFKEGHKGHMAFVQRVNNEGEGDPFYEVIGLVTLEDVIEELIQAEIMDETDVFTDNRSKRKRLNTRPKMPDFTVFAEKKENHRIHISPQLTLAMFQYLSTTVGPFKSDTISETILRRLLKQDIIHHIKVKSREKAQNDPLTLIYQQGKSADYFVLILEGRVEVTVGKENLTFESGPFTYFGCQALSANIGMIESPTSNTNPEILGSIQSINLDAMLRYTFVPDYSVRAITELFYLKVRRSLYLAAKRATLLERSQKDPSSMNDQFDDEVEKLLHSLDEDDRSVPESPTSDRKLADSFQPSPIHSATAPSSPLPTNTNSITSIKCPPKNNPNGQIKSMNDDNNQPSSDNSGNKNDSETEVNIRQSDVARLLACKKTNNDDEETINLLSKKDNS